MFNEPLLWKLSPYIRVAMDHHVKRITLNPRIIFDYELLYLEKGRLFVSIEDESHELNPGDILLLKPGKTHSLISDTSMEAHMPHIHFDPVYYDDYLKVKINFKPKRSCSLEESSQIRPDILGDEGFMLPDIIKSKSNFRVLGPLKELISLYERKDPSTVLAQKTLALNILSILIEISLELRGEKRSKSDTRLDDVISYITCNYQSRILIADLAKICCLSIHHFERLFKQRCGFSPMEYIIRYRLAKSKELMHYTQMSLCEISERVGYSGIHAFSKAFKRIEGISPGSYIKNSQMPNPDN